MAGNRRYNPAFLDHFLHACLARKALGSSSASAARNSALFVRRAFPWDNLHKMCEAVLATALAEVLDEDFNDPPIVDHASLPA